MKKNMKQLVAVVTRGETNYWTRIGVAYENSDGSWNLRFELLPASLGAATIQLRDFRRTADEGGETVAGAEAAVS